MKTAQPTHGVTSRESMDTSRRIEEFPAGTPPFGLLRSSANVFAALLSLLQQALRADPDLGGRHLPQL
jgi:hypothetical protein